MHKKGQLKMNKTMNFILALVFVPILALCIFSQVSAANPYNIDYTGGEPLGEENVTIDPDMINNLQPLIGSSSELKVEVSNSDRWLTGYRLAGSRCSKLYYLRAWENSFTGDNSGEVYYTMSNEEYKYKITISDVVLDGINDTSEDGQAIAVVVMDAGSIGSFGKGVIYTDAECETPATNIKTIGVNDGGRFYVQTNIKLYKGSFGDVLLSDNLYFGITDIDAAQSYKILNPTNLLVPGNMYAKSAEGLQSSDPDASFKNMYVEDNNYIYSQYGRSALILSGDNNLYIKINTETQRAGVDLVFGFAGYASSGVQYYAQQYTVNYKVGDNGKITGSDTEKIIAGENPSGVKIEVEDGYEVSHFIADKDVVLSDGTIIKAGANISEKQLTKVVVNQDITFIAVIEKVIAAPDTGVYTEETSAVANYFIPIATIITVLLIVSFYCKKVVRKTISFDK